MSHRLFGGRLPIICTAAQDFITTSGKTLSSFTQMTVTRYLCNFYFFSNVPWLDRSTGLLLFSHSMNPFLFVTSPKRITILGFCGYAHANHLSSSLSSPSLEVLLLRLIQIQVANMMRDLWLI